MTEYQKWLAGLKPGDKAARTHKYGWGQARLEVVIVDRLTNTQIIMTDGTRYRRINGDPIPSDYGDKLMEITPKVQERLNAEKEIRHLNNIFMRKPRGEHYTPEQRRAILAIMEGNEGE